MAGGWYDQSPRFVDHMLAIMGVEGRVEKKRSDERERQAKKNR